jgi:hypothetical protein
MTFYFLRVALISFEALLVLIVVLVWYIFNSELEAAATVLTLNEEFLKYMFLAPLGLGFWVVNESRLLLQEDKETIKILTNWPEYLLVKMHVWVGLMYALIFVVFTVVPWALKTGVNSGLGLLFFVTALVGQLIVAASIYSARIRLKEIIAVVFET